MKGAACPDSCLALVRRVGRLLTLLVSPTGRKFLQLLLQK